MIVEAPIDCDELLASIEDDRAGAVVSFAGVVRNHDGGREVSGIEYVAHPSASGVLAELVADFERRDGVHGVLARHRVGDLRIGDVALFVAVAASHRAQAFGAAADLVDSIKVSLPVWKKQLFPDGSHEWAGCP